MSDLKFIDCINTNMYVYSFIKYMLLGRLIISEIYLLSWIEDFTYYM